MAERFDFSPYQCVLDVAGGSGGMVVSIGTRYALLLDLHMLLCCEPGARERSEADYRSLLEEAGFRDIEIVRLNAPRDMIVARKK